MVKFATWYTPLTELIKITLPQYVVIHLHKGWYDNGGFYSDSCNMKEQQTIKQLYMYLTQDMGHIWWGG